MKREIIFVVLVLVCLFPTTASAGNAADLAALMQDPMATISALETDTKVGFRSGPENDETYKFELQPVHAIVFEEQNLSVIPRATIPYIGIKPDVDVAGLTNPEDDDLDQFKGDKGHEWGLGDITTQFYIARLGQEGLLKFGLGPQLSWRTRSDNDVKGAGWGAGPSAVAVGTAGPWAFSLLGGHLWGYDGDFSTTSVQPAIFFNFVSVPGAYVYYDNTVSYDHKTKGGNGNSWTVPLGIGVGRTFDMGGGHALDLRVAGYHLPSWGRPGGGIEYEAQLKVSWMFPR